MATDALTGEVRIYHGALLPGMGSRRPVAELSDQTVSLSDIVQPPFKQTSPGGKKTPWIGRPVATKKVVSNFTAPSQEAAPWHHCKALLNIELAQNGTCRMSLTGQIKTYQSRNADIVLI